MASQWHPLVRFQNETRLLVAGYGVAWHHELMVRSGQLLLNTSTATCQQIWRFEINTLQYVKKEDVKKKKCNCMCIFNLIAPVWWFYSTSDLYNHQCSLEYIIHTRVFNKKNNQKQTSNDVYIRRHTGRKRKGGGGGGGDNDGGGSALGRSRPWCPAPISSCRSSSHSCPLVTSSRRWVPPRRSGRTGHGRGRLPTGNYGVRGELRDTTRTKELKPTKQPTSEQLLVRTHGPHTHLLVDDVHPSQASSRADRSRRSRGRKKTTSIDRKYYNKMNKPAIF